MSLDEQLRAVIDRAAQPVALAEVGDRPIHAFPPRARRMLPIVAGAIVAMGVAATLIAIDLRDRSSEPSYSPGPTLATAPPTSPPPAPIVPPAPVAPEGDEYPIEAVHDVNFPSIGMATDFYVDATSVRYWRTAGATLFRFRTIGNRSDYVVDHECDGTLEGNGSGYGCSAVVALGLRPSVGGAWTEPAGIGVWQWSNVPTGTDFVQYRSGELVLWQRPVERMASFPATSDDPVVDAVAVAYRADGAVLATADAAANDRGSRLEWQVFSEWSEASRLPIDLSDDAEAASIRAFGSCLTNAGATYAPRPDNVRLTSFPSGTDVDEVWNHCLVQAQIALDQYIAEQVG